MLCCGRKTPTAPTTTTTSAPQPAYTVTSFVSTVIGTDGSTGTNRPGSAPSATSGPAAVPTANTGVVTGGSNQVRIRAASAFQIVYVFVGNVTGGVGGYWELRLASSTTDTNIIVTFGRQIPTTSFDTVYAVATAAGVVGAYSAIQTRVLPAATGDVQVTASWDALSDVDLHVVDPRGEEVYYGNSLSASGGQLDLDSNSACSIDGKNNENIRWPTGRAPVGNYTVRLDYWDSCGVSQTNYVVTVNNGGSSQTFRGSFTGLGDQGGAGSGRFITSFTRAALSLTEAEDNVVAPLLPVRRFAANVQDRKRALLRR